MIDISVTNLVKEFEVGTRLLDGLSFQIDTGERVGLLGPNGCGKTTLLKILTGSMDYDEGEVVLAAGKKLGLISQIPVYPNGYTVEDVLATAFVELHRMEGELAELASQMGEDPSLLERYDRLMTTFETSGGYEIATRTNKVCNGLSISQPMREQLFDSLSGGEKTRVNLARLILEDTDILLLDEPTNHLDLNATEWLEDYLEQFKGTVLTVSHDRYFLDNVAGWILELDRGEGIPWKGNYSSWLEQKSRRLAMEEKQESKRRKTLERELEWVRMAPKARQAKSKARLGAYEKLAGQDAREKEASLEIFIPNGPRLGNKVISFNDVSKSYGDKLLFEHLSFVLPPAGIVGVIGPNGAGKTTLFRLIMGYEKPDSGSIEIGETVKLAYVDQQHKSIDPEKTVYQTIAEDSDFVKLGRREVNARAYVSRFNFSGADQEKLCGVLSGGERNRLHLALTLKDEGNVLLLDEPTNDVDVNTIRALEEGLENFAGCAVVISHDRWFLDRIATHILAFEGDSSVYFFEGSYSEYEENRKMRLGNDTPSRFKYKKLVE